MLCCRKTSIRFFQCLNEVESWSGGSNDVAVGLCLGDLDGQIYLLADIIFIYMKPISEPSWTVAR